jgi:hypothetical protein
MNWTCNQDGQWEGTNELWSALVFRPAVQATWSAIVWLARLPTLRHEHHGFVDAGAARSWCEAEMQQLQLGQP